MGFRGAARSWPVEDRASPWVVCHALVRVMVRVREAAGSQAGKLTVCARLGT